MHCPFCLRQLEKDEIKLKESFPCPKCHNWLRTRPNPLGRAMGLAGVLASMVVLFEGHAHHRNWTALVGAFGAVIFPLMETLVRQLHPPELEPAEAQSPVKPLG